jgi:hypothetical protein
MTITLFQIYDNKYPSITKVLIYKQNNLPLYKYHLHKGGKFVEIKIVVYNRLKIYERYVYNKSNIKNIVCQSSTCYWSILQKKFIVKNHKKLDKNKKKKIKKI